MWISCGVIITIGVRKNCGGRRRGCREVKRDRKSLERSFRSAILSIPFGQGDPVVLWKIKMPLIGVADVKKPSRTGLRNTQVNEKQIVK